MFCYISVDKLPAPSTESRIIPTGSFWNIWSTQHGLRVGTTSVGWPSKESYCVPRHIVVWKSQWARAQRPIPNYRPPSTLRNLRLAGSRTGTASPALRPWSPRSHKLLLLRCTPVSVANKPPVFSLQHTPTNLINFPFQLNAPASHLPQLYTFPTTSNTPSSCVGIPKPRLRSASSRHLISRWVVSKLGILYSTWPVFGFERCWGV